MMNATLRPGRMSWITDPRSRRLLVLLALAAVAAAIPAAASPYAVGLTTRFVVFSILALSMDLLWGYGGVVSFGHAMFFGLGAYAAAITLSHLTGVSGTYLAFVIGIGVPSLLALGLGFFLFYSAVAGVYFGIVTLALSVVFETLAVVSRDFTGGMDGLYGFAIPTIWLPGLGNVEIWGTENPYIVSVVGLAVCFGLARWITRSSFGIAIRAIRDDEARLELLGYNTAFLKTVLLVITCAMAGLAGTLYTTVGFVSPQLLGVFFSTQVLVWVGIGGRGTLVGPILGTILVGFLETILSGEYENIWPLFVGLFFLAIVLFWPRGLYPFLERGAVAVRRFRRTPEATG
ncbi:MAG: branched-chain amino acid ABC transporter permease [Chloroflexota bacterium]|nr:MAG: branched-chain amino acid ABC transporter permease [Chloroflexota bacterium]